MRDSFVFYRSFFEGVSLLPDKDKLEAYNAICEYSLNGVEPELGGTAKAVFLLIKPQIDANTRRYQNGLKGKDFGAKGGRPKKVTPKPEVKLEPKPEPKPKVIKNCHQYIDELDLDDEVYEIVSDWLKYKDARKESYKSIVSVKSFLRSLEKMSKNNIKAARIIVDEAMSRNWMGIHDVKVEIKEDIPDIPAPKPDWLD